MVTDIEMALAAEKAESAHQRALNAIFLRISRERANDDRKLRPKKNTPAILLFSPRKQTISTKTEIGI